MIALYVFSTSGTLIALLLGFKGIEYYRGQRFFEQSRDALDLWIEAAALALLSTLPRRVKAAVNAVTIAGVQRISVVLLKIVRRVEYRLSTMVHGLRGKRHIQKRQRPMSSFIESVSSHKVNGSRASDTETDEREASEKDA
jgi:hypothetical protein